MRCPILDWGPTVNEINHLAADFDEMHHIAFLHTSEAPPSSLPYTASNIEFVPLNLIGGKGLKAKFHPFKSQA